MLKKITSLKSVVCWFHWVVSRRKKEIYIFLTCICLIEVFLINSTRCSFLDPFVVHFETELSEDFVEGLSKQEKWKREEIKVSVSR